MGFYVNPTDGRSKEQWLSDEAREVRRGEVGLTTEELPIVLVNNSIFTAAGIADTERELAAFLDPADPRPKRYFMCARTKLESFL